MTLTSKGQQLWEDGYSDFLAGGELRARTRAVGPCTAAGSGPASRFPGVLWLIVLFVVPFYAVLGVAFGTVDPILFQPVPIWNPLEWNVGWLTEVLNRLAPGGIWFDVGDPDDRLRRDLARALPADRLPGRLLHGPARRAAGRA